MVAATFVRPEAMQMVPVFMLQKEPEFGVQKETPVHQHSCHLFGLPFCATFFFATVFGYRLWYRFGTVGVSNGTKNGRLPFVYRYRYRFRELPLFYCTVWEKTVRYPTLEKSLDLSCLSLGVASF